jgi:hypothetical protein
MKLIGSLNNQLQEKPYLHRIELLERFFQILDNKEMVMVQPQCWTDPMENIVFNARIIKNGKRFEHPAKDKIYGQCWSYDEDSYALWQIYTTKADANGITKRHPGVRITTHLDRLHQISDHNNGLFYYGVVDYLTQKELLGLPKNEAFVKCLMSDEINEDQITSLLIKRNSYNYEKEVRLLAVPDESLVDPKNRRICRIKINPLEFISSVRLDPSLTIAEAKELKSKLVDQYGFKPTAIKQSTLGRQNKLIFKL